MLRFYQEMRADNAAEKLKAMVSNTATLVRDGLEAEVALKMLVPVVFLINGLTRHNWVEAFLFATAVAVGLTPEMMPMIVRVNLSQGSLMMARKKVISRGRRVANCLAFGRYTRICSAAASVLAATCGYVGLLCNSDPGSEDLVHC